MGRTVRILSIALLVALGALAVEHGLLLARGDSVEEIARAVGERRWLDWAFRDPGLRAALEGLEEEIPPGERIHLRRPPDAPTAPWLTVMARYFLPGSRITVEGYEQPESGSRVLSLPDEAPAPPQSSLIPQLSLLAGGTTLMLLVGFWTRGARNREPVLPSPREWATALLRGLTLTVPVLVVLRLSGVGLSPGVVVAGALSVAVAGRFLLSGPGPPELGDPSRTDRPLAVAAVLLTAILGLLLVWKVGRMPLWSWDHFAIWGLKARQLVAAGGASPEFLTSDLYRDWAGHYPLGMPVAWITLLLGAMPEAAGFKGAHLLLAAVLVLLVGTGARRLGCSPPLSWTLAAWTAASPLLWDTESLGLPDLALAVWAVAGWLTLRFSQEATPRSGMEAGALLGFLPWIKLEGGPLAMVLLLAGCLSILMRPESFRERIRRWSWLLGPAVLWILGAGLVSRVWLPRQPDFFRGAWLQRAIDRLSDPGAILLPLGRDLLRPEWLGLWVVFVAGWIFALITRRHRAAILGTAILLQLGVYTGTYFATYLPPVDHIRSSFFRIAAALAPPAILVLAEALGGGDPSPTQRHLGPDLPLRKTES